MQTSASSTSTTLNSSLQAILLRHRSSHWAVELGTAADWVGELLCQARRSASSPTTLASSLRSTLKLHSMQVDHDVLTIDVDAAVSVD